MQKSRNLYHNMGYWLLLYIPLAALGFYVTYFSVILKPKPALIHIHFALVLSWMCLVIAQPFLIRYKKLSVHRILGKISYVLVPLVLLSGFAMMRFGFDTFTNGLALQKINGLPAFSGQEINRQGHDYIALPFVYLFWLACFYLLAIINKKNSFIHARYMMATALTFMGPIVDRVLFFQFHISRLFGKFTLEYFSFFLIDVILLLLLWKDYRNKKNMKPLLTCLVVYVGLQTMYYLTPGSSWWDAFAGFILRFIPSIQ